MAEFHKRSSKLCIVLKLTRVNLAKDDYNALTFENHCSALFDLFTDRSKSKKSLNIHRYA